MQTPLISTAFFFLVCGALLSACSSGREIPRATQDRYDGPAARLDPTEPTITVVIASPSAGWSAAVDRVVESHKRQDIFVTLRRPDPRFIYTQQIVEQRLATSVRPSEAARLCVRVLDFDADPDSRDYPVVAAPTAK